MLCLRVIGSGQISVSYLIGEVDDEPIQLFWLLGMMTCTSQPKEPGSDPGPYSRDLETIPSFRVNSM
jgi:hypothetical protein